MYLRASFHCSRALKNKSVTTASIVNSISQTIATNTGSSSTRASSTIGASSNIRASITQRFGVDVLNSSKQYCYAKSVSRLKYSGAASKCWKCGHDQQALAVFCNRCNIIQRPDSKLSYFIIFGIEENYEIKLSDLTSKYRKLQNVLHPDRFTNRDDEEKQLSEEFSSLVNKAYFTLLNPLKRGLYMLEQKGVFVEEGTTQSSPQFLMEIMERNEDVDDAESAEQLEALYVKNKESFEKLIRELTEAFKMKNLKLAEETVTKMKYYASIDLKIKELKQKDL